MSFGNSSFEECADKVCDPIKVRYSHLRQCGCVFQLKDRTRGEVALSPARRQRGTSPLHRDRLFLTPGSRDKSTEWLYRFCKSRRYFGKTSSTGPPGRSCSSKVVNPSSPTPASAERLGTNNSKLGNWLRSFATPAFRKEFTQW
jgi:hypothetical protein